MIENNLMLEAALSYARHGWTVFPCHKAGKTPMTTNGHNDASADPAQINKWWTKWPEANIGFAVPAHIVVVDVDIKHDKGKFGDETLAEWVKVHGELPETPLSLTGGGGMQFFFATDKPVTCKNGLLPSIDIKTKGGYVILPPSLHESGRRYEWEASSHIDDTPLAALPGAFYSLITTVESNKPVEVPETIPEGARNDTLFKTACSLRAKGLTESEILAAVSVMNQSRCTKPLPDREIMTLVASSAKYNPGPLPGMVRFVQECKFKPKAYTDSGNSDVFLDVYRGKLIFVRAMGWLFWTGQKWKVNDLKAVHYGKKLAKEMLLEATAALTSAREAVTIAESTENKDKIRAAKEVENAAAKYRAHALHTGEAPKIHRMLELAKHDFHVELEMLDADPFALNTAAGIVDLRTGEIKPHDPRALCTNITKVAPSSQGREIWNDFLDMVTCGDKDLRDYLQQIAGMAAVGRVFMEMLVIAYGDGGNGKSTLYNSLAHVLGDYAGAIAAEVLTTDRQNKGASLAELKGKRLVIAAELEEGKRLSASLVKQLASTDRITAERKYKDPESFTPSHSVVLYTNHKPKVGSSDAGTWRRLALIPFNAKIPQNQEVKNFGFELISKAGGAILEWIIEGAVRFCANGHKLVTPASVAAATSCYHDENDWLSEFIECQCDVEPSKRAGGQELLTAYRLWAEGNGDYVRDKRDFMAEMERRGFMRRKTEKGAFWYGIGVKPYVTNNGYKEFYH